MSGPGPVSADVASESSMKRTHSMWPAVVVLTGMVVAAAAAQQVPDRSHPPAPGPIRPLTVPAVRKSTLANGLRVWIVEHHKVPVVQANLVVFSGSAEDPAGKFGVANLTAALLQDGAGSRSALEVADAVDFLGADLTTAGGIDSSVVRLHVPVARFADALPIMADVALRPTFPSAELDRVRQQRLTSLLQARDDPPTIAAVAFSRMLFGPAHRFGTMTGGTAETIKSFTPEDLRSFYRAAYRPDNAALVIVGDVTAARAMPLVEAAFGAWKSAGAPPPSGVLPPVSPPASRTVYLLDKPGAAQSQIRIGALGVARSTPDYFPLEVLNTILGGSFTSRLNNNLREQHGYAYGAGSAFDMRVTPGPFFAAAGVQTDKTSEALKEFFNELNGILKPVPAAELDREKHYVALRYPSGFETTGEISRQLENLLVYHLGDDYFSTYVQRIEAVSAADVQRVAEKYLHPDRMIVVVVGDLKVIEPGIRALNLGPVKTVTLDEAFGGR
jgi:zinc protease